MIPLFRAVVRLAGFFWISARAFADFLVVTSSGTATLEDRAAWSHRWGRRFLKLLGVELRIEGTIPTGGLVASNHLSYLDIVVFGAARRQVFLSKAEVRGWPVIGGLAACAGTLFVRRENRADVAAMQDPMASVIEAGIPITIFPEGTSSDGSKVLPFFSSFFEPAVRLDCPVTPAWIGYEMDDGNVAEEVCYWRDMTFLPHFLKLLTKRKIYATVVFGKAIQGGLNRKQMASALHREVSGLAAAHSGSRTSELVCEGLMLAELTS